MSNQRKILVVEDNDFVRAQLCLFLKDDGHDVFESADGEAALALLGGGFDLAIVDVRMEPMDGFEFTRIMRSNHIKTPVILVTGDDNPDLLNEASRLDVAAVLKKPVQRDRLVKMVSRSLRLANL